MPSVGGISFRPGLISLLLPRLVTRGMKKRGEPASLPGTAAFAARGIRDGTAGHCTGDALGFLGSRGSILGR
jgi:hypothetical protein